MQLDFSQKLKNQSKLIMLNQLKLILHELFRIWHRRYQPTHLYLGLFIDCPSLLFLDLCGWQCGCRLLPRHQAKTCVLISFVIVWSKNVVHQSKYCNRLFVPLEESIFQVFFWVLHIQMITQKVYSLLENFDQSENLNTSFELGLTLDWDLSQSIILLKPYYLKLL